MKELEQRVEEVYRTPVLTDEAWKLIKKKLPEDLQDYLLQRNSAERLTQALPICFPPKELALDSETYTCWEQLGNFHRIQGRFHDALSIYHSFYDQLLAAQEETKKWLNKGTPLVWISDCYFHLGFSLLGKRYLMLVHCEDSIARKGGVPSSGAGATYFRLVWHHGMPDSDVRSYAKKMYELWNSNPADALFPEWILENLDQNWMTEFPSPKEASFYITNRRYIKYLMRKLESKGGENKLESKGGENKLGSKGGENKLGSKGGENKLGSKGGENLEQLARYMLSCMPGCRTTVRRQTKSGEHDIVCSMEGFGVDFRSELGRYFVCECKDLKGPANVTTMLKFCRVLDSTKSRFGILFSTKGISGQNRTLNAERERLKVYQDRGILIVVVDLNDIKYVAEGGNFMNLLRKKYETVRLDLSESRGKHISTT